MAIVGALSLFVALVAGSASRPTFAAPALPEPTAWSQGIPDVGAHADQLRLHGRFPTVNQLAYAMSRNSAPTNKKPFLTTWMAKDRPATWSRLSPESVRSPLPLSFTPLGFQPGGVQSRAPAAGRADPDILTELCVARR
jgi:hypothetical protein